MKATVLTYTWRVDGLPVGGSSRTLDTSWSARGTHRVNVTLSDGSQQDRHEWTVTVRPVGDGAVFDGTILAAVALFAMLVAALFALLLRLRRGRQRPPAP